MFRAGKCRLSPEEYVFCAAAVAAAGIGMVRCLGPYAYQAAAILALLLACALLRGSGAVLCALVISLPLSICESASAAAPVPHRHGGFRPVCRRGIGAAAHGKDRHGGIRIPFRRLYALLYPLFCLGGPAVGVHFPLPFTSIYWCRSSPACCSPWRPNGGYRRCTRGCTALTKAA